MPRNITQFREGETVVCPTDGIGKIISIVTMNGAEGMVEEQEQIAYYKVSISRPRIVCFIPVETAKEVGMRKLCSKEMINKMHDVLSRVPKPGRGMWNKRVQEYDAKIRSGSILLTAEVVRDLFSNSNDASRSYGEGQRYDKALYRITAESAAVLKIDLDNAQEKIIAVLQEARGKMEFNSNASNQQDDFDDQDLEIYNSKVGEGSSPEV